MFEPPAYTWIASVADEDADGLSGSTGLYSCSTCGAVVEGSTDGQHTKFHEDLYNLYAAIKEMSADLDDLLS